MTLFRYAFPLAALLLTPLPAMAAGIASGSDLAIAAQVGEDAITSYDVESRIKFVIATAQLSNTPDVIARIRPQVIRSLIDERLQMQEAARNDIKISDDDINKAIAGIEQQREMPRGAIDKILADNHVPKTTFLNQIRAQLSWNKLLMRKVKPQVKISDAEIDLASRRMELPESAKPEELQIAVLALPVDKPSRELEMHRLGDKLVHEIRGGASFEEVARQFGASASGGKVESFWVRPEQLDPAIAKALESAKKDTVSEPIRTQEGYTIVKVYDVRTAAVETQKDMEVTIKEILLKLKDDASGKETDAMMQVGEEVARHPGTCEEKGIANISDLEGFDIEVNMYHNLVSELPAALKTIAESLKVGDISTPFASNEGIRLYMLCGKKESNGTLVDRDRVYGMLMQQKMELEAQKYMRNLRRDAFVDIR